MADIAIVYHSQHHGNTKKLLDAIAAAHPVDLIAAASAQAADLSGYQVVGFASGIYMSKFHRSILDVIEKQKDCSGKKAFLLFTSGANKDSFAQPVASALAAKGFQVLGEYHCKGFDTFGPFKLVGGIAKGHPTAEEVQQAVKFYEQTVCAAKNG